MSRDRDFERVHKHGRRIIARTIRVSAIRNDLSVARLGIRIPRKAGNAVKRNQLKRWTREAFRQTGQSLPGFDLVVSPNFHAIPDSLEDILADFEFLQQKLLERKPSGNH